MTPSRWLVGMKVSRSSCCLARECEASSATVASHHESASAMSLREAWARSRALLRHSRKEHDRETRPRHAGSAGSPRTARRHRRQPCHNERRAHAWAGMSWPRSMTMLNALVSVLGRLGGSARTRRATHCCKHVATGARLLRRRNKFVSRRWRRRMMLPALRVDRPAARLSVNVGWVGAAHEPEARAERPQHGGRRGDCYAPSAPSQNRNTCQNQVSTGYPAGSYEAR